MATAALLALAVTAHNLGRAVGQSGSRAVGQSATRRPGPGHRNHRDPVPQGVHHPRPTRPQRPTTTPHSYDCPKLALATAIANALHRITAIPMRC